jgi:formate-nitrite transporter family protein
MMGLLSWLVTAGRATISQVFFVWLITWAIGISHLHHAIVGAREVLVAFFAHQLLHLADFGRIPLNGRRWATRSVESFSSRC